MLYSVGDMVVHPLHGPGQITSITSRELLDGTKRYYVIEMPRQGLTVQMPVGKADELGVRAAMSATRLPRLLGLLRGKPHVLPTGYRERQELISAQLRTGRVMELARVVRDLTWHRARAHLTERDSQYLQQGRDRLVAEMALVSGKTVSDTSKLIDAAMIATKASTRK
jgi:CarD family transcriptional regulator